MAAPTITRGRMTVRATGMTRIFQFNPSELRDQKGITWGSLQVPGSSHPIYQFGAGNERLISFDLYLDGDRARFGRETADPSDSLSIQTEINFYRSLLYPGQYDSQDFAAAYPYLVLFSFGQYIPSMPVIVKQANVTINYWTPLLEPVRATVAMELGEIVLNSVTSKEVSGVVESGAIIMGGKTYLDPTIITAGRRR
jgi:hypothetical protein